MSSKNRRSRSSRSSSGSIGRSSKSSFVSRSQYRSSSTFDRKAFEELVDVFGACLIGQVGDVSREGGLSGHPVLVESLLACLPGGGWEGDANGSRTPSAPSRLVVIVIVNLSRQPHKLRIRTLLSSSTSAGSM